MEIHISYPYFAGLFDGEGSCGIYTSGKDKPEFRVSICNNDPRPLHMAVEAFGGSLRRRDRPYRGRISCNWEWYSYGANAGRFLTAIRPYTVIKSDQIDVFIATKRAMPGKGHRMSAHGKVALVEAEALLKRLKREVA